MWAALTKLTLQAPNSLLLNIFSSFFGMHDLHEGKPAAQQNQHAGYMPLQVVGMRREIFARRNAPSVLHAAWFQRCELPSEGVRR